MCVSNESPSSREAVQADLETSFLIYLEKFIDAWTELAIGLELPPPDKRIAAPVANILAESWEMLILQLEKQSLLQITQIFSESFRYLSILQKIVYLQLVFQRQTKREYIELLA
jgi:hypothetical protein